MNGRDSSLAGAVADPPRQGMATRMAYHPYVLLSCSVDAGWTRRRQGGSEDAAKPLEAFDRPIREIRDRCRQYCMRVESNYKRLCAAGLASGQREKQEKLDAGLFGPLFFVPFGHHPDIQALVLLDDFDPLHYLPASLSNTVEDVSLGFCPTLESLHLRGCSCLVDPHILFRDLSEMRGEASGQGAVTGAPGQRSPVPPLCTVVKLRMDALAVLGQGLLFQEALFRILGSTISSVTDAFGKTEGSSKFFDKGDAARLKCCLLDLQGPEEIGLLLLSNNFTLNMAIVFAIRSLTYGDVFMHERRLNGNKKSTLENLLNQSRLHEKIIARTLRFRNRHRQRPTIDQLRDNHVFRWSEVTFGLSPDALWNPKTASIHGLGRVRPKYHVLPGHEWCIGRAAAGTTAGLREAGADCLELSIAGGEYALLSTLKHVERGTEYTPMATLVAQRQDVFRDFGSVNNRQDQGRDIFDVSGDIIIPIPLTEELKRIVGRRAGSAARRATLHFSPLEDVLAEIRDSEGRPRGEKVPKFPGNRSVETLRKLRKQVLLPLALRRNIEYLYQNYLTTFADECTFDLVLDLYDGFAALYRTLTHSLPRIRDDIPLVGNAGKIRMSVLDKYRVHQITLFLDALQNAMSHRLLKAYPEQRIRDTAIDFRGALCQLLFAADAPMKCAMGLVRRCVINARAKTPPRDRVGCILRIGLDPGARIVALNLGTEDIGEKDEAMLAFFDVDVPHIFHPASYAHFFHEAVHVVVERWLARGELEEKLADALNGNGVMSDRLTEILVSQMCQMMIFGSDRASFLADTILAYSRDLTSLGLHDAATAVQFCELAIRLFLATDGIGGLSPAVRLWPDKYPASGRTDSDEAWRRFGEMLRTFGPLFSEYQRLWPPMAGDRQWGPGTDSQRAVEEMTERQFRRIYSECVQYMPAIWEKSLHLYSLFVERDFPCTPSAAEKLEADISRQIDEAMCCFGKTV